jgi:hypothetical protein
VRSCLQQALCEELKLGIPVLSWNVEFRRPCYGLARQVLDHVAEAQPDLVGADAGGASRRTAPVGKFPAKATMFFVRVSGARGNMAATRDALSLRCLSRDDPTVLSPVHGAAP